MITLNFALLERLQQRRWVVTLGGCFLIIATVIFYYGKGPEFAIGIGLRSAAASLFSVCISLYIMDYIGKRDLTRTESKRMVFNGVSWLIGPVLGIWLWDNVGSWAPFAASSVSAVLMLTYFWHLRLGSNKVVAKAKQASVNPLKVIPRYFSQPSLIVAYLITLSRSMFWVSLFVYGPIYVIEAGLPQMGRRRAPVLCERTAIFQSSDSPDGRPPDHTKSHYLEFIFLGVCNFAFVFPGEPQPIGILLWVISAFGCVALDVLGNIPFMRLVKPRERTEMTMIFSTWREGSELLTPLLVALVVLVLPFKFFYLLLATILISVGYISSYLPKRL